MTRRQTKEFVKLSLSVLMLIPYLILIGIPFLIYFGFKKFKAKRIKSKLGELENEHI